jgi:hypothetical protein
LPAVGRPLDGRVRRLMEHGLVACHEREFATREVLETGCFGPSEPSTNALRHEARTIPKQARHEPQAGAALSKGTPQGGAPRARPTNRAQWLGGAALRHNLDASTRRASTAPNRTPAKPAMSATRLTRSRAAVARRSPQDERPASTMANYLAREPKCSDACALTDAALTHGCARCGLRASRLTFDLSGVP